MNGEGISNIVILFTESMSLSFKNYGRNARAAMQKAIDIMLPSIGNMGKMLLGECSFIVSSMLFPFFNISQEIK